MKKRGNVSPQDGGCWFCYSEEAPLLFDDEFDTFVHEACIREALRDDPDHPEAQFMKYLLTTENLQSELSGAAG